MSKKEYRDYGETARDGVREFYAENHRLQTVAMVRELREKFLPPRRRQMTIWEAMEHLNELVDDSDPDLELPQIAHAMQTAEAIRADGHPDWFILAGLIHDLGKVLCLFGEPQWAVVGDTFPVGCQWSERIVYHELFEANPDAAEAQYQTETGIYQRHCGLDRVLMSWGHDEYLYHVVKERMPLPALYMIRFHSFYAAHAHGEYAHLMDAQDQEHFHWVREFNRYDLYTKSEIPPDTAALTPYYQDLVKQYFPDPLWW